MGSPDAITPEWLTAVLCQKVPGAVVTGVVVKPSSAGTHERHQLIISYNEAGRRADLPGSIFTKSLPSVVTRMIGESDRYYADLYPAESNHLLDPASLLAPNVSFLVARTGELPKHDESKVEGVVLDASDELHPAEAAPVVPGARS